MNLAGKTAIVTGASRGLGPYIAKTLALKGVRIIDASSVLMVPYCTKLLADMGAEIIKIEAIDGDITRHIGPSVNKGMGAVFLNINRNKKSVCIDLKSPEGRLIIYKLIKIFYLMDI